MPGRRRARHSACGRPSRSRVQIARTTRSRSPAFGAPARPSRCPARCRAGCATARRGAGCRPQRDRRVGVHPAPLARGRDQRGGTGPRSRSARGSALSTVASPRRTMIGGRVRSRSSPDMAAEGTEGSPPGRRSTRAADNPRPARSSGDRERPLPTRTPRRAPAVPSCRGRRRSARPCRRRSTREHSVSTHRSRHDRSVGRSELERASRARRFTARVRHGLEPRIAPRMPARRVLDRPARAEREDQAAAPSGPVAGRRLGGQDHRGCGWTRRRRRRLVRVQGVGPRGTQRRRRPPRARAGTGSRRAARRSGRRRARSGRPRHPGPVGTAGSRRAPSP